MPPGVTYLDSSEFVNTAFTLGIAHPAGFPTYSLLAGLFTFLPVGSVAFKVNLFSIFCACLTLAGFYLAARKLLDLFFAEEETSNKVFAALIPSGFLAYSAIFWHHALMAEVYSLHTLFICALVYLLLTWKQCDDLRYLYAASFIYGISAGNHATMAFFLPSILLLFFCWNREKPALRLALCALFFLVGFSVYAYLPARSLAEPSFDWGNPETLDGFVRQITDRDRANSHFDGFQGVSSGAWQTTKFFFYDLVSQLSLAILPGFLFGGYLCFKKSRPFFFFALLIVVVSAAFFARWEKESYPSYLMALWFASLALYWVFEKLANRSPDEAQKNVSPPRNEPGSSARPVRWNQLAVVALFLMIAAAAIKNYYLVEKSGHYFGESLTNKIYLSVPDHAIFAPGLSWFQYYYAQDVMRLRDDVVGINTYTLLANQPAELVTPRRFPTLDLPDPEKYKFDSHESVSDHTQEIFDRNLDRHPIVLEQDSVLFERTKITQNLSPYKNALVRYSKEPALPSNLEARRVLDEFMALLAEERKHPGYLRDLHRSKLTSHFIHGFHFYFHDRGFLAEERVILSLMRKVLEIDGPEQTFFEIENRVLDGKIAAAEKIFLEMQTRFPDDYYRHLAEGILRREKGDSESALKLFTKAAALEPENYQPRLESALAWNLLGNRKRTREEWRAAFDRMKNLRQWGAIQKTRDALGLEE